MTVLCSALTAFFGMLMLNGLPNLHHWSFFHSRFERVTSDRYFISIEASDPNFDIVASRDLLELAGSIHTEMIWEFEESDQQEPENEGD